MIWIILTDIVLLFFGIIEGIYRVYKSERFIERVYSEKQHNYSELYNDIVIIVPVYNEQNVIRQSFLNFKSLMDYGIEVIYVATEKEDAKVTTYALLEQLIEEYQIENYCRLLLYPKTEGVMAHQLNYAVNHIENDKIVFIYNVDSVVDIKTIDYILKNRDKLENDVFQQYSYSAYETKSHFITSAIMWQNRWSVSYELPRTIKNVKVEIDKFNYVIGHGLALRKKMLDRIGRFSEEQINEDNVLGYRLHAEQISINPVPHLEKIDFAADLKTYVKQQSVWFNGPLYAFRYFLQLRKEMNDKKTVPLFFAACQNFKNALNWMIFPYMTFVSMAYLITVKRMVLFFWIFLLLSGYVTGINRLSERILIKKGYLTHREKITFRYLITDIIFWLWIHSFGPIITLYKIVTGQNNQKNKYKTEKVNIR